MSVLIGHARGGDPTYTPGDQTGAEVRTQAWYNANWNLVLRPKTRALAEAMAKACEAVCANNNIGYSQARRNDLRAAWLKANKVIANIQKPADCDCSSLMSFCAEVAGADPGRNSGNAPWTGNMREMFLKTGKFEALTDSKYLKSPDYLLRGDVLVNTTTHTAMCLTNGPSAVLSTQSGVLSTQSGVSSTQSGVSPTVSPTHAAPQTSQKTVRATEFAHYFDAKLKGQFEVSADSAPLRNGAGSVKKELTTIPRGTKVMCYGYHNIAADGDWLFIQVKQGNVNYEAFIDAKHLSRF